ncbi:hypothetical protein ABFG93_22295 (plasmid) [Pseudalkalibacillus hwajinpoensis]|uniref:hypothetical protein n=1 Tax=Guptibacillus hwajinpoensis TaxID=208199 RepID=UPI00325B426C
MNREQVLPMYASFDDAEHFSSTYEVGVKSLKSIFHRASLSEDETDQIFTDRLPNDGYCNQTCCNIHEPG